MIYRAIIDLIDLIMHFFVHVAKHKADQDVRKHEYLMSRLDV